MESRVAELEIDGREVTVVGKWRTRTIKYAWKLPPLTADAMPTMTKCYLSGYTDQNVINLFLCVQYLLDSIKIGHAQQDQRACCTNRKKIFKN